MPKRSNEFQRILTAIHALYAPSGAKVTSSAMVKSVTGEEREVDILVEIPTDLFTVSVGVETKDHGRKLDNTAIDNIKGKFSELPIRDVIVVARGFSKNALRRAAAYGIKCHTLVTLESEAKGTFSRSPPAEPVPGSKAEDKINWGLHDAKGNLVDQELAHEGIVFDREGRALGKALDIAKRYRPNFPAEVQRERKKREGCFVKGELLLQFTDHTIRHGSSEAKLGRLGVSTSGHLIIPDLKATAHTLETSSGMKKEVITETASNEYGHYTIVHEKSSSDAPERIQVHFTDKNGTPGVPTFVYKIALQID